MPSTAGASFETAPHGRAKFRFSSYGDLATPSWDLNTSGNIWHESCDNSWFAVTAIENPGDGKGAPLFHLLNGDLCYANLDVNNAPGVWRDFGNNVARSAANRPWMPALGNHECEFGIDTHRRQAGRRARRDRRAGRGGELLERPVRLRPLPEPVPAARQRRDQLGRQPAARQLLRLPGRHREVHLARRGRRHLPGRRRQLRDRHREHRAGDHHDRCRDSQRHHHLHPLLHRRPEARREEQLAGPRLRERQAQPADDLAGADAWRRPATTRRWT